MSHTPIFWKCAHNDILTSSQMTRSFCRRDSPPWYINGLVLTIGKQAFCLTHTKSYNFCLSALFFTAHPCRLTSFSFRHTSHSLAHSISFSLFFFLFRLSFRTYRSIYAKTFSGCLWMRSIQNYTHSKLPNEFFFCFDAIFSPCRSLCSFTLKCNVHITHQSCVKGTKKDNCESKQCIKCSTKMRFHHIICIKRETDRKKKRRETNSKRTTTGKSHTDARVRKSLGNKMCIACSGFRFSTQFLYFLLYPCDVRGANEIQLLKWVAIAQLHFHAHRLAQLLSRLSAIIIFFFLFFPFHYHHNF